MNADEKLRDILRAEADVIEPSPAGWDRIKETIVVRRRRRLWLRGSLAAATAMSLVAVVAITAAIDRDDRGAERVDVVTQPPTVEPTPAPAPDGVAAIGVWPLTTLDEIDAWNRDPSARPYLADVFTAADVFGREYLGIPKPVLRAPPGEAGVENPSAIYVYRPIEGTTQDLAVTELTFPDDSAPYTVLSAKGGSIDVTSIRSGATVGDSGITSPVVVRGTFAGIDQPIDVVLRAAPSAGGAEIAKARAEIGPDGWTATLTFSTTAETGSLLATTYSNADGGLADAYAIPVSFGKATAGPAPAPSATQAPMSGVYPAQFVGAHSGRIALFDTRSGDRVRYLTEEQPGGGASDPFVTDDGRSVVYVQGEGTCAASIRKIGIVARRAETLVQSKDGRVPSLPKVASDGTLAYAWTTCDPTTGGDTEVVVGTKRIPVQAPDHATVSDLAWDPDGVRLAVVANFCCDGRGEVWLIDPAEVMTVSDGDRIGPDDGRCGWTGVAFTADNRVLASEGCPGATDGDALTSRVRDLSDPDRRAMLTVTGREWIDSVDADGAGDHLILGVLFCEETCDHAPSSAQRFSIDGAPRRTASDVTQPVWVD
ncbi:MAG TPA: hypothetical protein VNA12_07555 [Mycobacteriales bacterium]|nr:hypothetical protein [Mycobacteriales bacterium]